MAVKEIIEIISSSSLWKELSIREKMDAVSYALGIAGKEIINGDDRDNIGEVYKG